MPAATYSKLATVTVGVGGAATIEFANIPQSYTDLKILVSARSNIAAYRSTIVMAINGIYSSTYAYRRVYGTASTAGSDVTDPTTYFVCGEVVGASSTANTFTNTEIYISGYSSSTFQKPGYADAALEQNDSTNNRLSLTASKWSGTQPISNIKLYDSNTAQLFVQYSTATLYGIRNS